MKNLFLLSAIILVFLSSCEQDDFFNPEVKSIESTGDYLINNNSDLDISVSFVTSSKLGFIEMDDKIVIPAKSSQKIFDADFVSEFPYPASAFYSITFFNESTDEVLLELTVRNEGWDILQQNLDENGYGYALYQYAFQE